MEKRIHITSCSSRTGTTLITEAINACFDIDGYTESERRITKSITGTYRIRLTKQPVDLQFLGPFLRFDPGLHVLCMMRDPRDIVISKHGKQPEQFFSSLASWRLGLPYIEKFQSHPRFKVIRYEDLVSDPDSIQSDLKCWLPWLQEKFKFSQYHLVVKPLQDSVNALNGVRPIASGSVGVWRNHYGRVKQQIAAHGSISDGLIKYGYKTDNSWQDCLLDVEEEYTKSVRHEFPVPLSPTRIIRRHLGALTKSLWRGLQQHI